MVNRCHHKLGDILAIALCTTLCGSTDFTEMEARGQLNEDWLATFLDLPNGIPSHDVFRAVLNALEPKLFLDAFLLWVGGLRSVVAVELESVRGGKKSVERRYFITSHSPDSRKLAGMVRAHWSVENKLHWSLGVVFGEDASRARTGNGASNQSTLRRLSQNLLKVTKPGKYEKWTMKKRKLAASQDRKYLEALLGLNFDA